MAALGGAACGTCRRRRPEALCSLFVVLAGVCAGVVTEPEHFRMTHLQFLYPLFHNTQTARTFVYTLNESLCDDYLCATIQKNGHIDDSQLLMQEYLASDSVVLDIGSHMGEYMPITLLQGAWYISLEASPKLVDFQRDVLARNPRWSSARIIHGYFSAYDKSLCADTINPGFLNFVWSGCAEPTLVVPRFDMTLLKDLKWEFPMKVLFVKYDAMINLCEFASSTYLGDYVDYEYVNWREAERFAWGFPDCFGGALEEEYDVFVPTQHETYNARLLPVDKIPDGPVSGGYTHVVLIKKRLRIDVRL